MAISYNKLFHLMIDKNMSNAQLKEKAGFSANIITRLKRNEYVSMESIEQICACWKARWMIFWSLFRKIRKGKKHEPKRTHQRKSRPDLGDCR